MWLIYLNVFECNEIGMCICVSDQVSDDYVMMEITWRSVGNSVIILYGNSVIIRCSRYYSVWKKLFLWKKYGRSYSE